MSVQVQISNGKVALEINCDTDGEAGQQEIHQALALALPAWREVMETIPVAQIVELEDMDYQLGEKESEDVEEPVTNG